MKSRVIRLEGAHIHATVRCFSTVNLDTDSSDPHQVGYTPLPPRLREEGLIKYGVVKVVNQAKKNPTAIARPKVRLLNLVQGSSPAITHERGPIVPP